MDDVFTATIWDVEHGSAAIAQCPNGKSILLDAGSSPSFSPATLLEQCGYGPARRIDQLIISHPDQDHITDLPEVYTKLRPRILARNKTIPNELIYRGFGGTPETEAKRVYKQMHDTYVYPINAQDHAAPAINWGGVAHATFHVDATKHPDLCGGNSCNNYSIVTVFSYGPTAVIFPGDIEDAGMRVLLRETSLLDHVGRATFKVLVAPHHGRAAGVSTQLLDALRPSLTIMSDAHGAESTDYSTYYNYSGGLKVIDNSDGSVEVCRVVTTKTNAAIELKASADDLWITRY